MRRRGTSLLLLLLGAGEVGVLVPLVLGQVLPGGLPGVVGLGLFKHRDPAPQPSEARQPGHRPPSRRCSWASSRRTMRAHRSRALPHSRSFEAVTSTPWYTWPTVMRLYRS